MIKSRLFSLLLLASISFGTGACSSKINSEKLTRLEGREAILDLNTQLNNLKINLEKETLSLSDLQKDVEQANETASKSSLKAKDLSDDLSKNPGDLKLSSRASKAANEAARDAKRAAKLNEVLGKSNNKMQQYEKDIESTTTKLKELESKIEFTPNTTNQ